LKASLAAGAWLSAPAFLRAGEGKSIKDNLGIQIFTVRELMQKDPLGTLTALSRIGYREIELVAFGGSIFLKDPLYGYKAPEFRKILDDLGMRVPSTQFSSRAENLSEIADAAQEVGVEYMVMGMAADFLHVGPDGPSVSGPTSLDQVKRIADRLNEVGRIFKSSGAIFAYHNHHMEFDKVEGQVAYDVMLANTDPDLVKLEMDIGWSNVAGVTGWEYLDRFPERYMACHLKDFDGSLPKAEVSARSPIPEMIQLVAPGKGKIDFVPVLAAMDRNGIKHGYIEIDLPDDALAAAQAGYEYLRSL